MSVLAESQGVNSIKEYFKIIICTLYIQEFKIFEASNMDMEYYTAEKILS